MVIALRFCSYILFAAGLVVLVASLFGSAIDGEPLYEMFNPFNIKLLITAGACLAPGAATLWLADWLTRRNAHK